MIVAKLIILSYSYECKGNKEAVIILKEGIMGKHVAPEKFVVGETVVFCSGEYRSSATVFVVNGDTVTAGFHPELAQVYVPREDGKHVKKGTPEFAIMPDVIFHPEPVAPAKPSFWNRVVEFFA